MNKNIVKFIIVWLFIFQFVLIDCVTAKQQLHLPDFNKVNCDSTSNNLFCDVVYKYRDRNLDFEYSLSSINELIDKDINNEDIKVPIDYLLISKPLFKWAFINRIEQLSCSDFDTMLSDNKYVDYLKGVFNDIQFIKKLNTCDIGLFSDESKRFLIKYVKQILSDNNRMRNIPPSLLKIIMEYDLSKSKEAIWDFPINYFLDNNGKLPAEILSKLFDIVDNSKDEEIWNAALILIKIDNSEDAYNYLLEKSSESRTMLKTALESWNVFRRCDDNCMQLLQIKLNNIDKTEDNQKELDNYIFKLNEIREQQHHVDMVIQSLINYVEGQDILYNYTHNEIYNILHIYNSLPDKVMNYLDDNYFYDAFIRTKEPKLIPLLADKAKNSCDSNYYFILNDSLSFDDYFALGENIYSKCGIKSMSFPYLRKRAELSLVDQMNLRDDIEYDIIQYHLIEYAILIQFDVDCSQVHDFLDWFSQFQRNDNDKYYKAFSQLWLNSINSGCIIEPEQVADRELFIHNYLYNDILIIMQYKPNYDLRPYLIDAIESYSQVNQTYSWINEHIDYNNLHNEFYAKEFAMLGDTDNLEKYYEHAKSTIQMKIIAWYLLLLGKIEYEKIVLDEINFMSGEQKYSALMSVASRTCSETAFEMMYLTANSFIDEPRTAEKLLFTTAVGQVLCNNDDIFKTLKQIIILNGKLIEDKSNIVPFLISIDNDETTDLLINILSENSDKYERARIMNAFNIVPITTSALNILLSFSEENDYTNIERAMIWLNSVKNNGHYKISTYEKLNNVQDLPFIKLDIELNELHDEDITPEMKDNYAEKYRILAIKYLREYENVKIEMKKQIIKNTDSDNDKGKYYYAAEKMLEHMPMYEIEEDYKRIVLYLLNKSNSLEHDNPLTLAYMSLANNRFDGCSHTEIEDKLLKLENVKYPEVYHALGNQALCSGNTNDAIKYFLMALELNENYCRALFNLYIAETTLNNAGIALEYYEKAKKLVIGTDDEYILDMIAKPNETTK